MRGLLHSEQLEGVQEILAAFCDQFMSYHTGKVNNNHSDLDSGIHMSQSLNLFIYLYIHTQAWLLAGASGAPTPSANILGGGGGAVAVVTSPSAMGGRGWASFPSV